MERRAYKIGEHKRGQEINNNYITRIIVSGRIGCELETPLIFKTKQEANQYIEQCCYEFMQDDDTFFCSQFECKKLPSKTKALKQAEKLEMLRRDIDNSIWLEGSEGWLVLEITTVTIDLTEEERKSII